MLTFFGSLIGYIIFICFASKIHSGTDDQIQNLKSEVGTLQRDLENLKKDTESDIRRIHNAFDNVVFKRKDDDYERETYMHI